MDNANIVDLIRKIQEGENCYEELYNDSINIIRKIASKYCRFCQRFDNSIEFDDLMQESFFALIQASQTFDLSDTTNNWCYWLCNYLSARFRRIIGLEPNQKKKPESFAVSLDAPLSEDEGNESICLLDLLKDESIVPNDEQIISAENDSEIYNAITEVLNGLTDQEAKTIIIEHDLKGKTFQEVAKEIGKNTISSVVQKRSRIFRQLSRNRQLREISIDCLMIRTDYHIGVTAFQNSHISEVEKRVFDQERVNGYLLSHGLSTEKLSKVVKT